MNITTIDSEQMLTRMQKVNQKNGKTFTNYELNNKSLNENERHIFVLTKHFQFNTYTSNGKSFSFGYGYVKLMNGEEIKLSISGKHRDKITSMNLSIGDSFQAKVVRTKAGFNYLSLTKFINIDGDNIDNIQTAKEYTTVRDVKPTDDEQSDNELSELIDDFEL